MKTVFLSALLALSPVRAAAQTAAPEGAGVLKVTRRHQVAEGDTLWGLAEKYYADPFKWGKIFTANMNLVADPDLILPQWELLIPGLTEEIKAAKPEPPAEPEKVEELLAPPMAAEEELPRRAPAAPPAAALSQGLGSYQKLPDLSEEMPEDQKEWNSFVQTRLAAPDWREDGLVTGMEDPDGNALPFTGETVSVRMRSGVMCKAGDYLEVYKVGSTVSKKGKVIGIEIQRVALLEVLSSGGRELEARVLDAGSPVLKGLSVKKK